MRRRLDWSARGFADLERLTEFYAEAASPALAREARDFIFAAADRIAARDLLHRPGRRLSVEAHAAARQGRRNARARAAGRTSRRRLMKPFVLDAGVFNAWLFPESEEERAYAAAVLRLIREGDSLAVVPQHFHVEVAAFLLRRRRTKGRPLRCCRARRTTVQGVL